jgi:hypothetical protein
VGFMIGQPVLDWLILGVSTKVGGVCFSHAHGDNGKQSCLSQGLDHTSKRIVDCRASRAPASKRIEPDANT